MQNKITDLRVLSGTFRGTKIRSPQSALTHPMGAREKLALFNMLQPYLSGAKVLDAYAGSGALGIEAMSLGASEVTFVEKTPKIATTLQKNLEHLNIVAEVFIEPISKFAECTEFCEYFDLIIADPPYDNFVVTEVAKLTKLLKLDGVLALSFPAHLETPTLSGLTLLKNRSYATAGIVLYRKD